MHTRYGARSAVGGRWAHGSRPSGFFSVKAFLAYDGRMNIVGRSRPAVAFVLPVVVLLAAFALRTATLSRDGFWYDEAFTAVYAQRSALEIVMDVARFDLNTPLHYLLLKGWAALAGPGEYAQRMLSVFAGMATVALVPALVAAGRRRRLAALALAAAWPVLIDLSIELRMYALAICMGTASLASLLRGMRRDRPRDWAAWAVFGVAAFGSHVLGALFFAAMLPSWLRWWQPRRARSRASFVAAAIAVASIGVCGAALATMRGSYGVTYVDRLDFPDALYRSAAALFVPGLQLPAAMPLGAALSALLIGAGLLARRAPTATVVGLLAVGVITVFCAVVGKFAARYVAFAIPALLGGACAVRLPRGAMAVATTAVLALAGGFSAFTLVAPAYANTDFRGAVRFLRQNLAPDEVVVLVAGHVAPALTYYWPEEQNERWFALPDDPVLDVRNTIDYEAAVPVLNRALAGQGTPDYGAGNPRITVESSALAGRGGAWLLLWQDDVVDPAFTVRTLLSRRSVPPYDGLAVTEFHDLRLLHYRFAEPWRPMPEARPAITSSITPHGPDIGLQGLGCAQPDPARRGDGRIEVLCFWRVAPGVSLPGALSVSLRLQDDAGRTLVQQDQPLAPFGMPGIAYDKTILTSYALPWPEDPAAVPTTLEIVTYTPDGEITPRIVTTIVRSIP